MNKLIANGVSTCTGGTYEDVEINGVITVNGAIICENMLQEGVCEFAGGITVKQKASIKGTSKVRGSVEAENLNLAGVMNLNGNLTGENLVIDGAMDVSGEINAEEMSFLMSHGSGAKSVFGHSIEIRRGKGSRLISMLRARKHEFTCEHMECDKIKIEYCNIKTVSGEDIEIGPQCRIGTLEYSGSYTADPTAVIDKIVKVGTANE